MNALSAEIAALVRAGVPLERGLANLASSRGRLAELADEVRTRLERGESLADAVPVRNDDLGAAYRMVVAAGTRSGRLGDGLEAFLRLGRARVDFRRQLVLALLHPVIVLCVCYVFVHWFTTTIAPRWARIYEDFALEPPWLLRLGFRLGEAAAGLWMLGPILLVLLVAALWVSGRTGSLGPLVLVPFAAKSVGEFRTASFCDLLSLLVGQGVPLPEALLLAGRGAGDARIAADAERLAGEARTGAAFAEGVRSCESLPKSVRWILAAGQRDGSLPAAATHAAALLRRRATRRMSWIRTVVPVFLVAVIGGTVVLGYALMLWIPFVNLLNQLS